MKYHCSICDQNVSEDLVAYVNHTEAHILDVIKSNHPDWIEKNGLCPQCLEYYRSEMKGSFMHPTRCATRRKKIWRFLTSFWKQKFSSP